MRLVNAKAFSAESGFPLGFVRRCCREGKIPHWKVGRVYMMDYDVAFHALVECSNPSVPLSSKSDDPQPLLTEDSSGSTGYGNAYLISCLKDF